MHLIRFSIRTAGIGLLLLSGCQGPLPTMGPLSTQNGGRVPPPGTGSFQVPGSYSPSNPSSPTNTNNPGFSNSRPLTQQAPIGTGIVGAVKEEGWHAINDGKVVVASAANSVAYEAQNQVNQAAHVVQNGFARITSRLADETARIADEYSVPPTNSQGSANGYLGDNQSQPMRPSNDEPSWRKPQQ